MLESFIIVAREGFEGFLIVAIILAYLRKSGQDRLVPSVYWAVVASLAASTALGYVLLQGVNQALWEGVLGLVAVVLVATLVIHMWRAAPHLKRKMEARLGQVSSVPSSPKAHLGVFLFTAFMITREGMETGLMLLQVHGRYLAGGLLGLLAAVGLAFAWGRLGHLVNVKRFFQVTGIFLLLFMVQIAVYSFHEFSEAGLLPNSEAIHEATEPLSPYGFYGKWFSFLMVAVCASWLAGAWFLDRFRQRYARGGTA